MREAVTKPGATLDRWLRFGCGCLVGCFVALFGVLSTAPSLIAALGLAGLIGIVFGLLALRYGQRFLDSVFDWFNWFS